MECAVQWYLTGRAGCILSLVARMLVAVCNQQCLTWTRNGPKTGLTGLMQAGPALAQCQGT